MSITKQKAERERALEGLSQEQASTACQEACRRQRLADYHTKAAAKQRELGEVLIANAERHRIEAEYWEAQPEAEAPSCVSHLFPKLDPEARCELCQAAMGRTLYQRLKIETFATRYGRSFPPIRGEAVSGMKHRVRIQVG